MKASICIFQTAPNYTDKSSTPDVPTEVFEAAQRVIENKGFEIVRLDQGFYLIEWSENGPFVENVESEEWLSIKVYRFEKWRAGGIRQEEMAQFLKDFETNAPTDR